MNRTVLITGASGGIGYELSKIFAKNGYDLILVARNEGKLNSLKEELERDSEVSTTVIACDLSIPGAAADVRKTVSDLGKTVDILVNNAGFGDHGSFSECDLEKQNDLMQVNIVALTQLTRLFLPDMIAKGEGKILNISSLAAFQPGPYMSVYYASKAFVLSFSEALSCELRDHNITVTASCPGPTDTGFATTSGEGAVRMFNSMKMDKAADIALFSYSALMKGKVVAVPRIGNKFLVGIQRILPRRTVRSFVTRLQK